MRVNAKYLKLALGAATAAYYRPSYLTYNNIGNVFTQLKYPQFFKRCRWESTELDYTQQRIFCCQDLSSPNTLYFATNGTIASATSIARNFSVGNNAEYNSAYYSVGEKLYEKIIYPTIERFGVENPEIVLSGHSQGGGIMALMPLIIGSDLNVKATYLFAAPRVWSQDFEEQHIAKHLLSQDFVNFAEIEDAVPFLGVNNRFSLMTNTWFFSSTEKGPLAFSEAFPGYVLAAKILGARKTVSLLESPIIQKFIENSANVSRLGSTERATPVSLKVPHSSEGHYVPTLSRYFL